MSPTQLPRILIVDHFDSYTLNLLTLLLPHPLPHHKTAPSQQQHLPDHCLAQSLSERVLVLPHTHPLLQPHNFRRLVQPYIDALIFSPGPGSPDNPDDFGAAHALLTDPQLGLPVLGVCLGHQGLATAFGGRVVRARSVRHGLKTALHLAKPRHDGGLHLMRGVAQGTEVIRYNSLTVDEASLPSCLRVTAWGYDEPCSAPPPQKRPVHDLLGSRLSRPLRPSASGSTTPREYDPLASGSSSPSIAAARPSGRAAHRTSSDGSSLGELDEDLVGADVAVDLDRVVLALEHTARPLYGVQFHPESIESSSGRQMMQNFLALVCAYWKEQAAAARPGQAEAIARYEALEANVALPAELQAAGVRCVASAKNARQEMVSDAQTSQQPYRIVSARIDAQDFDCERAAPVLFRKAFRNKSDVGAVWLDSARRKDPHSRFSYMGIPAFSLSYHASTCELRLMATRDATQAVLVPMLVQGGDGEAKDAAEQTSFWDFMDSLQGELKRETDRSEDQDLVPDAAGTVFRTGFVGYFGYEMKAESLGLPYAAAPSSAESRPDCEFLFCNRVLAFDHHLREWTAFALTLAGDSSGGDGGAKADGRNTALSLVQDALDRVGSHGGHARASLALTAEAARSWFDEVAEALRQMPAAANTYQPPAWHAIQDALPPLVPQLSADEYMHRIEEARELIAAGESYELCMTTQFRGTMPALDVAEATMRSDAEAVADELDHFGLYCKLRVRNPAPYSAFLRLPSDSGVVLRAGETVRGRSVVCTSPERFMRVTAQGEVEMKPIKGTLARAGYGPDEEGMRAGGGTAQEEEEKRQWREAGDAQRRSRLAADVKERAENLMIVDLIRADLLSFCQPDTVLVPKLMSVESYETVHQLVTTVVGRLTSGVGSVEALRRCFPPGSMTGAPKRRSVQLLEQLETNPSEVGAGVGVGRRGIYSGVLGWLGIDGNADFAVVIRTMVAEGDRIEVGAGGAVTYLSDPEREWDEVVQKLTSLACTFS
ncbi:para-aminobenzoate synthase, (PABA) [Thecaphora frezii]